MRSLRRKQIFAAAKLLFLRHRFRLDARSLEPRFKNLEILAERYGKTKTSTFCRCIEYWGEEVSMVGLITGHPQPSMRKADFDPDEPCKHFVQSPPFAAIFSQISESDVFDQIVRYCGSQRGGSLGVSEILLTDDNGDGHRFEFESFCYHYQTLTSWGFIAGRRTQFSK
jgi:hypothetical protein